MPDALVDKQLAQLARLRDFAVYAETYWNVPTKSRGFVPFVLNRAQEIVDAVYSSQMKERGFVRINILKCRQVGGTTYSRLRANHFVMTHSAVTALTIAHEQSLPRGWLDKCKNDWEKTPAHAKPSWKGAGQAFQLNYGNGSRYYIGSAQGGFPGVGDTIHFLHISELGRWDKSPISLNPTDVLYPLQPAIPSGEDRQGTVILRESTGVARGDYWHKTWMSGKDSDDEFENIFLPWFLVDEYRREDLILENPTSYEMDLRTHALKWGIKLTDAQLAWRRNSIRQPPFFGNTELWGAEFPAYEHEAFMSPGQVVFGAEQIAKARKSCRSPNWRGDLVLVGRDPKLYRTVQNAGGDLLIWEDPDERFHYVLGADCRWGARDTSDWDVAYVQCLETNKICARMRGKYSLGIWGRLIAGLGHHYNTCVLAPERNSVAATVLMPMLLGNTGDWSYPNIYVRSDDVKLRGHKPQDFGWLTDVNSRGDIISFAQAGTAEESFDWCDSLAVDEAEAWIHDEKTGKPTTPEGAYDDCLMARMITAYVAHREKFSVDLWRPKIPKKYTFRTMSERMAESLAEDEDGPRD